jgi:hypothetical protein
MGKTIALTGWINNGKFTHGTGRNQVWRVDQPRYRTGRVGMSQNFIENLPRKLDGLKLYKKP